MRSVAEGSINLLAAYCLLPTAYCLLLSAYCLLLSAICLLLSAFLFYAERAIANGKGQHGAASSGACSD